MDKKLNKKQILTKVIYWDMLWIRVLKKPKGTMNYSIFHLGFFLYMLLRFAIYK